MQTGKILNTFGNLGVGLAGVMVGTDRERSVNGSAVNGHLMRGGRWKTTYGYTTQAGLARVARDHQRLFRDGADCTLDVVVAVRVTTLHTQ